MTPYSWASDFSLSPALSLGPQLLLKEKGPVNLAILLWVISSLSLELSATTTCIMRFVALWYLSLGQLWHHPGPQLLPHVVGLPTPRALPYTNSMPFLGLILLSKFVVFLILKVFLIEQSSSLTFWVIH